MACAHVLYVSALILDYIKRIHTFTLLVAFAHMMRHHEQMHRELLQ